LASNIIKKLVVNVYSFSHFTLILLIHYRVIFRSRCLDVYNNEFILGSACVGSEMINSIATNTNNSCYLAKRHTCHITLFELCRRWTL